MEIMISFLKFLKRLIYENMKEPGRNSLTPVINNNKKHRS